MRPRVLLPALGLVAALLTGCSTGGTDRKPGDPVTQKDAAALAELLHRDFTHGGSAFVVSAPYAKDTVLTLTGEVDFRNGIGHARAVTSFGDGRADDARTLVFTGKDLWIGEVPGLPEALAAAGVPGDAFLHRALTTGGAATTPLVDALLQVLLDLSAPTADDARSYLGTGYTWQGQRSIDSRLTSLFTLKNGRTVAVAAADDLLAQFETPLAGGKIDVTVTLSDHGPRTVTTPATTAEATDHPAIAASYGV